MTPIIFFRDFFAIYKFGDCKDKSLMILATILGICSGVSYPLFIYFWGKELDHSTSDYYVLIDKLDVSLHYYLALTGVGLGAFLVNGIVFALWKFLS